jgi:GMP synthase (glutamine-hydrolysing)
MKRMRPFLILQLRPEDQTADSELAAILKYGGLKQGDIVRKRIEQGGMPEFSLEDYSAIIVGGSPFDISTPKAEKSVIQHRIEQDFKQLFDRVVAQDFPFLGACSGNGLLGSYLGAEISQQFSEPVSSAIVTLTDAGKLDPLLQGFPDQVKVLLGHKEACDVTPRGATLLMQGDACPVQMFRVGQNVYATQFHPEGDSEGFIVRVKVYKHHGYFPADEAEALIKTLQGEETPYAHKLLRRFVNRYARAE